LRETSLGAVRVDGCDGCGGVWFDHQELTAVARTQAAQLQALEDRFQPSAFPPERQSKMLCPTCQVELFEFEFKHSPGIKLDGCRQCQGIWVDDGELQAISQRLAGASAGASPAPTVPPPREASVRAKARQVCSTLLSFPCPQCREPNPNSALTCWACGAVLQVRREGLLCPRCDEGLRSETTLGVWTDVCGLCGGLWLDACEIAPLIERTRAAEKGLEGPLAAAGRAAPGGKRADETTLLCPVCNVEMLPSHYAFGSEVIVNPCTRCRGLWLDQGELPAIVEFLKHERSYYL
jgi:Zn-finger nucleic acid-binding protein